MFENDSKIKEYRIKAGYKTAKEFAEKIGMEYSQYTRYEKGKAIPTLEKAALIAESLACTVDELIGHPSLNDLDFDPRRNELIEHYERLPEHDKDMLLAFARRMCEDTKK